MNPAKALQLLIPIWLLVVTALVSWGYSQAQRRAQSSVEEDVGQFCVRIALGDDLIRCYDVDTGNFCYLRGKESIACVAGPFVERVPMLR